MSKPEPLILGTTTAPTSQLHTHQLQFNSIDTDTFLPAPPCQSSNGGWRPSSRELQLNSLLQPSRAWRICVATGSLPRWRLIHNVAKSRRFRLMADRCFRIQNKQPPLPPTGAIPWSRRRRVDGYRGDAMGGNIHPVASDLPSASSFNSTTCRRPD